MDILQLIDRLEELFNNSRPIPLTHNVIVDEDKFLDIIDQMRISVPEEVKKAQQVFSQKDRVMAQAQEEANRTLQLAREKADALVEKEVLVQDAQRRAGQIIDQARMDAENIKVGRRPVCAGCLNGSADGIGTPEQPGSKWRAGAAPEKATTGTSDPTEINKNSLRNTAEAFLLINPRRVLDGDIAHVADDHHHFAFDLQRFALIDHDRFHGGIGRLEPIAVFLLEEIFEGGLVTVRKPDGNHLTVIGLDGRFHDDDVAIIDHGIDHGLTFHLQGKEFAALFTGGEQAARHIDRVHFVADAEIGGTRGGNKHGLTGGNRAEDGNLDQFPADRIGQTNSTREFCIPLDQTHFGQLL